ncbi:MAG: hypothetical protein K0R67_3544, partial [Paenibacillus sp.]|nr:hypothetical protein [Paenibacillus sp.]
MDISAAFYLSLFDQHPDITLIFDTKHKLVQANAALSKKLGYSFDEFKSLLEQSGPWSEGIHNVLLGDKEIAELSIQHKEG